MTSLQLVLLIAMMVVFLPPIIAAVFTHFSKGDDPWML